MTNKINKKGQSLVTMSMFTMVLMVGVAMLLFSLISDVNSDVSDTATDDILSERIVNESVTWTNNTIRGLSRTPSSFKIDCITVLNNNTGFSNLGTTQASLEIGAGNFTCDDSGINLRNDLNNGVQFNITRIINVTYDATPKNNLFNVTFNGKVGLFELSEQSGNLGTTVGIFLVIAVLAAGTVFFFRRRS